MIFSTGNFGDILAGFFAKRMGYVDILATQTFP